MTQHEALRQLSGPRCKLGDYLLSVFFLAVSLGVTGLCVASAVEYRGSTDGQAAFGPLLALGFAFIVFVVETALIIVAASSIGVRIRRARRDCPFRWSVAIVLTSYIFSELLLIGGILYVASELGMLG